MLKRILKAVGNVRRHVLLISVVVFPLAGFAIGPLAGTPAIAADPRVPSDTGGYFHRAFFGILAHDVGGLWSRTRKEDGVDINGEVVFCPDGMAVFAGTLRPNLGLSVNSRGDTSKL